MSYALLFLITTTLLADEQKPRCSYLNEHLSMSKNNIINVFLLESAFDKIDCPKWNMKSIKGAQKTVINGITVLYGSKENINIIISSALKNKKELEAHISNKENSSKKIMTANFSGLNLRALTDIIKRKCGVTINLKNTKNKKIWLVSNKPVTEFDFCLSTSVFLAAHNVNLKYNNGVFTE